MDTLLEHQKKLTHLFKLVNDDSDEIQKIVTNEIVSNSLEVILNKKFYLETLDPDDFSRFEAILRELHLPLVYRSFRRILDEAMDEIDLEKSVLLLSFWHSPAVFISDLQLQLDRIAQQIKEIIPTTGHPLSFIDHINQVLFNEYRFSGNTADYYNPLNSFLHSVLQTKKGNPISLSVLYMLVCKRLHFPVFGVCMPAHFILKFDNGEDEIFFDPFYRGKVYSRENCLNYLRQFDGYDATDILRGCGTQEILKRILRNLHLSYSSHTVDTAKMEQVEQLLSMMETYFPDRNL